MAPPRKKRRDPGQGHAVYLRLPTDVFERIEAKAKAEGRPFNRIVVTELAQHPDLERHFDFAGQVQEMTTVLARYSARIIEIDLTDDLLRAVDAVLEANTGGELTARIERLRVVRAMLKDVRFARKA